MSVVTTVASNEQRVTADRPARALPFNPALGGALLGAGLSLIAIALLKYAAPKSALTVFMGDYINIASFAAFGSAMAILLDRYLLLRREAGAYQLNLITTGDQELILPEDAIECRRRLRSLNEEQESWVLVQLFGAALQRARASWSAHDAGDAIKVQTELLQARTDAHYAMLRYLAWAIPTVGFVSTLRGLAGALATMKDVMNKQQPGQKMDISEALNHLFTAFNTTSIALGLTLILMLFFYRTQAAEEQFLIRAADWCLKRFVFRMHSPREARE